MISISWVRVTTIVLARLCMGFAGDKTVLLNRVVYLKKFSITLLRDYVKKLDSCFPTRYLYKLYYIINFRLELFAVEKE